MTLDGHNLAPVTDGAGAAASAPSPRAGRRFRYSDANAGTSPSGGAEVPAPMPELPPQGEAIPLQWRMIWLTLALAGACILFFYPTDLYQLVARWASDAGWSHGFVVPFISLFFVALKWQTLRRLTPEGTLWGVAVLLIGVCGQVLFRATGLAHMSNLSILVVLVGLVLFVFGWEYLKILWLPIGYLIFALPPPTSLYVKVTLPMQELAARLGALLMPLFGGQADVRGTIIDVAFSSGHTSLNVEQACSGMRMLVAFFALAVALAYSTDRPTWEKVFLSTCALPIAILCNGLRVTLTGVMAVNVDPAWAKGNAHEYFGMLMLIPALIMQLGIAWVLDRLFVDAPEKAGKS